MRKETVGKRLKRLREERGFSQRDVSSPGVSYAYISRVERGQRTPSVRALRQLATKLDVSADYLETGEQPFMVRVDPTGWKVQATLPEDAIHLARDMLDRARALGHRVPEASFYGPDGRLVRASVTRTDLATDFGVCWCGRGALYVRDGVPFCCEPHSVLWWKWSDSLRARTVIAQFIHRYGGGDCLNSGSTHSERAGRAAPPARASATSRTRNSSKKSGGAKRKQTPTISRRRGSNAAATRRKGGG